MKPNKPLTYALALAIAAISIVPVLYVILGGFRDTPQINADPAGLPHPWVWGTYGRVLAHSDFWQQAFNSTVIALGTTIGVVSLGVCAAFALARYRFRGREILYTYFTLGLLFPAGAAILPLYLMLRDLDLINSYYAVILPQVAFKSLALVLIVKLKGGRRLWLRFPPAAGLYYLMLVTNIHLPFKASGVILWPPSRLQVIAPRPA